MLQQKNEELHFTSGNVLYANRKIVGLCQPESGGEWVVYDGFDGQTDQKFLSKEDKGELADYMISLWKQFKEGALK